VDCNTERLPDRYLADIAAVVPALDLVVPFFPADVARRAVFSIDNATPVDIVKAMFRRPIRDR
jgi:hypothetical protein